MITLHRDSASVTKVYLRSLLRAVWLAVFFVTATFAAQTSPTGAITGVVSNTATGANLEGAELTLEPGNISVFTAREGHFIMPQVAPGLYTLTATYSGLDPKRVEVRVTAGSTSNYDVG